jgi:hypothetical protein
MAYKEVLIIKSGMHQFETLIPLILRSLLAIRVFHITVALGKAGLTGKAGYGNMAWRAFISL